MEHVRTQIINKVFEKLKTLNISNLNVFKSRVYNIDQEKLPSIFVYALDEEIEYISMQKPRTQERTFNFQIEICVKDKEDIDSALDSVLIEVENLILSSNNLDNLVRDVCIKEIETQKEAKEAIIGLLSLSYESKYYVKEDNLSQIL